VQFKAFAIVAPQSQTSESAHPERNQVVEHGACRPRQAPDPGDIVHRQSGLDGDLGAGRINIEISIEAKVPKQRHPKPWISTSD
jgi:hypothetical protein